MSTWYTGAKLSVIFMPGAQGSLDAAEALVPGQQSACKAQLKRLLQRLADRRQLNSPEQFRNEGDGVWAIKTRCCLRAYGWFDDRVFVVSHFCCKKKSKLDPADKSRALKSFEIWRMRRDNTQ